MSNQNDDALFKHEGLWFFSGSNPIKEYRGVCVSSKTGKWVAQINYKRKHYYLGSFDTAEEANKAYQNKAMELGIKRVNK